MKPVPRNSLSLKLLRVVLLCALLLGALFSCAQIAFELQKTRQQIDREAQRILAMFRTPATQALHSRDRATGLQIVEGLLHHEAVASGSIDPASGAPLAERSREPPIFASRPLTDQLLGRERHFGIALLGRPPDNEHYGDLHITLDTAAYGHDFLTRAQVIVFSGLLHAVVLALLLYLIYQRLLTKPLDRIIAHLAQIDPEHPGARQLPMLEGHEQNELGLWTRTANQLLAAIERNTRLRHEAEHSLQRMAYYDVLTGLPNRQHLLRLLGQVLLDARRHQRRVAVLCVGLDDFKSINEQFCYRIGDELLLALADRLRSHDTALGALARLGGDRFVLVRAEIEEPYLAAELAQGILDDLETPFRLEQQDVHLHASIGITLYPEDGRSPEKLLQKAEQTMTLAKRSHNRYHFYIASVDRKMRHRRELEKDLREALARDELQLLYQPQLNYRNHRVEGVEALLRWRHPRHGLVPPDQFVLLAEHSGSIIPIGEWVLEQACRQLREWHDQGFGELHMAVNLSAVQLRHDGLPRLIDRLLRTYRLPAGSLELEVTETSLMEDIQVAARHLRSLRRCGARIAIDDFGTGYSSLSYLKSLPLDKIKIDKSFVLDLLNDDDHDAGTIVRTIIQLARSLGKQVTAEGVETVAQEAYLISQDCHEGQGYLYSKPLPAAELAAFIRQAQPFQAPVS
ncbi:putative bifunctional diguanylate cyclase/phosphodiesterase [Azotobacter beijerinckii]|uniref:cyclic-guanylate-specific phosphodiesterase n=1 Tax=Azotobacter beijerinckii TaxID=170623 RepID=A0A1I3ZRU6_9GAMM|nr:GGDEF domain-containing phosphodiesterase [Azotobacter beijerinckii]SFB25717.1 diguanylate cyclase (GGDEF) domain-containing protein [Azotobacter beijerinckii]SFK46396.1 diguanylate cyclase (GGDEF) domain-containing protein [Azotobacter beijerinckii]